MLRSSFIFLVIMHGLIHLLGFVKAYRIADVAQLSQSIPKPVGAFWFLTALLFVVSAAFFLLRIEFWWIIAGTAMLCSQFLIFMSWSDAKFGTIANVIMLVPVLLAFMNSLPSSYQQQFKTEAEKRLHTAASPSLLTEQDLQHLPPPVQKYLQYVGAVGMPKVLNFRAELRGSMRRSPEGRWQEISARQYNFLDDPARLFYIESSLFGIPFDGYHSYVGNTAIMQIKVASLFQVVDARGPEMNKGETVTMFNDLCIMAPAALIDKGLRWETLDSLTVKAFFTNQGNTISATLFFDKDGALVNFISLDRYLSDDGRSYLNYPWSTPIRDYKAFGGRRIPTYGEAIWHTPEGEFPYARFNMGMVEYNCSEFKR